MKVKELAENLKTTTVELINKLSNVIFTEKITEEYEVSKDLEKKLAKMYAEKVTVNLDNRSTLDPEDFWKTMQMIAVANKAMMHINCA